MIKFTGDKDCHSRICSSSIHSMVCCLVFLVSAHSLQGEDSETAHVNEALKIVRAESEAIIGLASAGADSKAKNPEAEKVHDQTDQFIFRQIRAIATSSLVRTDQLFDYGSLLDPKPFVEGSIPKSAFIKVTQTRREEFFTLCQQVSRLQPELSIWLSGYLCNLIEKDEKPDLKPCWEIVQRWLQWSVENAGKGSNALHLDGYRNSWYQANNGMKLRYFIAYIGGKTGNEKRLREYITQFKAAASPDDEYVEFAMMLFERAVDLYCASPEAIPALVSDTFKNSFAKQLNFRTPDLLMLFRLKQLKIETQIETARELSLIEFPPAEFYSFVARNLIEKDQSKELPRLIGFVTDKNKNVRLTALHEFLFHRRANDVLPKLEKHQATLIESALELGGFCIENYELNKPHQFCSPRNLRGLAEMIDEKGEGQEWLLLRKKLRKLHDQAQKKFEGVQWYKPDATLRDLLAKWRKTD